MASFPPLATAIGFLPLGAKVSAAILLSSLFRVMRVCRGGFFPKCHSTGEVSMSSWMTSPLP